MAGGNIETGGMGTAGKLKGTKSVLPAYNFTTAGQAYVTNRPTANAYSSNAKNATKAPTTSTAKTSNVGALVGASLGARSVQNASANTASTSSSGSSGYSRSYGSGGGSGVTSLADNSAELAAEAARQQAEAQAAALRAQMQAREDAINAANSALDQQANAMRDKYTASLSALANDYQNLRDQAEAARYRAMYNQREALANRGALDSGAGRQETLAMNTKYNDNLNAINLQEAAEVADINNAINQMYASVAQQKAANMNSTLNDYAQRLQNTINAIYSGYTPENSAYYQLANNVLQNATSPTIETAQQGTQNNVGAAYAELLRRMGYNV